MPSMRHAHGPITDASAASGMLPHFYLFIISHVYISHMTLDSTLTEHFEND
jgi:hypothetical protein